jgi:uncharacterized Fe-S cluster-containing radical SAM superfamily protein
MREDLGASSDLAMGVVMCNVQCAMCNVQDRTSTFRSNSALAAPSSSLARQKIDEFYFLRYSVAVMESMDHA